MADFLMDKNRQPDGSVPEEKIIRETLAIAYAGTPEITITRWCLTASCRLGGTVTVREIIMYCNRHL